MTSKYEYGKEHNLDRYRKIEHGGGSGGSVGCEQFTVSREYRYIAAQVTRRTQRKQLIVNNKITNEAIML